MDEGPEMSKPFCLEVHIEVSVTGGEKGWQECSDFL